MQGNCRCGHHVIAKILMILAYVAGVLFFWGSWGSRTFWGFDASYWAWSVVVLVLLAKVSKFCGCCGGGCMCKCGSCEGGKCGGMHNEGHQHM